MYHHVFQCTFLVLSFTIQVIATPQAIPAYSLRQRNVTSTQSSNFTSVALPQGDIYPIAFTSLTLVIQRHQAWDITKEQFKSFLESARDSARAADDAGRQLGRQWTYKDELHGAKIIVDQTLFHQMEWEDVSAALNGFNNYCNTAWGPYEYHVFVEDAISGSLGLMYLRPYVSDANIGTPVRNRCSGSSVLRY